MSSKRVNESFLEGQTEETECLLNTFADVTKEFVSLEKMKNCRKDEEKLGKQGRQNEETFQIEHSAGGPEDVVILVDEIVHRNETVEATERYKATETHESSKKQREVSGSFREESKVEDGATFERFATLAEPEESENEDELHLNKKQQEGLLLYENFENEACENCFKVLEENAEQLTKLNCSEKMYTLEDPSLKETDTFDETAALKEKSCKFPHNVDLDSSGSFRASIHSLSTCQESLPSSRGCPSKRDLYLDLECRICHDAEGQDLISPCHCAGTSKWVHESCIIKWIRHTKTKQCEICTCPITVKRKKKPIDQWTRPSASCGPCNKLDIWYCFVLALCVLIIVGFVVLQSHYDVTDQVETTVIFASIYVLCGMIIMMKARYFWTWFVHRSSFWGNWKNLNEEWKIIEANEADVQSPVSPV
ncbi:E3 ubiquitin- ligase MARCH4-like [Paramuricea clavata]|uniref:E3 ubiquitin- ligase MARCH4-like n=1 Tax=Paramuricea clavata TaxID=317549 RepID=A0A6S7FEX8_PARCT|nr:E3 ubiquitin- ligase MARCH4-like [Paramuricea clavata]